MTESERSRSKGVSRNAWTISAPPAWLAGTGPVNAELDMIGLVILKWGQVFRGDRCNGLI
jgi:hypothetical protein